MIKPAHQHLARALVGYVTDHVDGVSSNALNMQHIRAVVLILEELELGYQPINITRTSSSPSSIGAITIIAT